MPKKLKQPWPTKAVMNQIYEQHLWGGKAFDFYSGEGSHRLDIIKPYIKSVMSFLKTYDNNLTVCDLGCGDFNIGKHLVPFTSTYIGIDIVDSLIKRNQTQFKNNHLEFYCLDIAKDQLPKADCVIIRQVLQHLSNAEIQNIVTKLKSFTYIILTEHLPSEAFVPNKDIISGQGIRLKHNSGVDLLAGPFNLKIQEQTILNKIALADKKGEIVTILYTL